MPNKKLTDLSTLTVSLSTFLAVANANGVLGKTNIDTLKALIDVSANITLSTATPSTNPGAPVGNRMWVAATAGTYTNFAGIVLATGEVAFLVDTGTTYVKVTLPFDFAAAAALSSSIMTVTGDTLITDDDLTKLTLGQALNLSGQVVTQAGYYVSKLSYPCIPQQVWQWQGATGSIVAGACCYDASGSFISAPIGGGVTSNASPTSFTIPANAATVRFSFRENTGDKQVVIGPRLVDARFVSDYDEVNNQLTDISNLINSILQLAGSTIITTDDVSVLTAGQYLNTSGVPTAAAGYYISTQFYPVIPGQTWRWQGVTASAQIGVAAYDASDVFLSALIGNGVNSNASPTSFVIPAGAAKIRFSFRDSAGDVQIAIGPRKIEPTMIEGYDDLLVDVNNIDLTLSAIAPEFDYGTTPIFGYIDLDGNLNDSGASGDFYYNSGYVFVVPGMVVKWRGTGSSGAAAVYGYDANKNPVSMLLANNITSNTNYINVTIPAGIAYTRATFRIQAGSNYSYLAPKYTGERFIETYPDYFVPSKIWAYTAEVTRLNPNGCIANNPDSIPLNSMFYFNESSQKATGFQFDTSHNDINVQLHTMSALGNMESVGTSVIKITHTTQSPATARNIIALGDSTTLTTSNAGIQGLWVNEVSRRLTGVGTAAQASPSPTPLALTNFYFRGTLGDQPIKHEGRGGWGFDNYLNDASFMSNTNAFWNGSAFSMDFYLNANNFLEGQTTGGVNVSGSNLTVLIQLGWNHVMQDEMSQVLTWAKQMIDIIHTEKPNAHIKLIGLAPPPELAKAPTTARGHATPQSIMRECILAYAKMCNSIAADPAYSAFVEYIHIGAQFFPQESYITGTLPLHNRTTTTYTIVTDHVHCNARGYAQIADIVFFNLLYNYARLT